MAGEIRMIRETEVGRGKSTAPRGICCREKAEDSKRSSRILIGSECGRRKVVRGARGSGRAWF